MSDSVEKSFSALKAAQSGSLQMLESGLHLHASWLNIPRSISHDRSTSMVLWQTSVLSSAAEKLIRRKADKDAGR